MAGVLERERELARIAELLDRGVAGEGSVLLIEGPAGIGKTALIAETRALAVERQMEWLTAHGGELEVDLPFVIVRELLARRIDGAPAAERRELMGGAARFASQAIGIAGDSGSAPPSLSATLHGLFWVCSNLTDRRPLVLAVDDVHWADRDSLRFIAYLAHRITDLSAVLVLARRTGEPVAEDAAIEAVRAERAGAVMELLPLSADAVATMLAESYETPVAEGFAAACHETTGGNPFFVRELAAALRQRGVEPQAKRTAELEQVRPERVATAVRARLRRLSPLAVALARAVAVLGAEVELRHAARLAGIGDRDAGDAADALIAAELLASQRPLAFRHPIIRSAVYGELAPGERAAAHAAAARQLADEGLPSEDVARHLVFTDALGDPWVADVLQAAARSATRRGAAEAARTYLLRAAAEPAPRERRAALLHELGAAELAAGSGNPVGHLQESLALTAPEEGAAVAETLAVAFDGAARHDDAVEMLLGEIPNATGDAALRLEGAMLGSAMLSSRVHPEAERLVGRLAGLSGDTPGERLLLANAAWYSVLHGGSSDHAVALARRALARSGLLGQPRIDAPPFWFANGVLISAELHDEHLAHIGEAEQETLRQGAAIGIALALTHRAWNAYHRGRIAEAAEYACDAVRATVTARWRGGLPFVASVAVLALVERGEMGGADDILREHGMAGELPAEQFFEWVLIVRGALRLAQGRPRDALADLDEAQRRQNRRGIRSAFAALAWRQWAAHTHAALGERDAARRVAGEQLEIARAWGVPGPIAAALRACATAEETDARVPLLRDACDVLERSDAGLQRMHALLELGAAMRGMRRQAEARAPLLEALDSAEQLGAWLVAERARAELAATGVTRRKRTFLTGVEALTPSERRVADKAADGLANPEIAQSLFVSRKTVEKHLANAYMKLGISSRRELPRALGEQR